MTMYILFETIDDRFLHLQRILSALKEFQNRKKFFKAALKLYF